MKTIRIMAVITLLSIKAVAQDSVVVKKRVGAFFSFGAGCLCGIPNENVNTVLQGNNLPPISKSMTTTHLGLGWWVNRLSIGYMLKLFFTQGDQGNSSYRMSGGGFSGEIRFQYELMKSGKFYITPYAGFGSQQYSYSFDSRAPIDLNTALQISSLPIISRHLSATELIGSAGAAFGFIRRKSTRSYKLGLQAGYQFAGKGSWRLNNELVQTPASSLSGLELKFEIAVIYEYKRRK